MHFIDKNHSDKRNYIFIHAKLTTENNSIHLQRKTRQLNVHCRIVTSIPIEF